MISPDKLPLPDYEPRDASVRAIVLTAFSATFCLAGVLAAAAWVYHARYAGAPTAPFAAKQKSFTHGADWQSGVARDWVEQDRRTRQNLTTYGWIDHAHGVVRIPIDRAISLVAQESEP